MSDIYEVNRRDVLTAAGALGIVGLAGGQLLGQQGVQYGQQSPQSPFKVPDQCMCTFLRLGNHNDYAWEPLPWKGTYNKVLLFERCTGLTLELARIDKGATF